MALPTIDRPKHPFVLTVGGCWFGGHNLLEEFNRKVATGTYTSNSLTAYQKIPFVDINSVAFTDSSDGRGGSLSFDIIQLGVPTAGDATFSASPFVYPLAPAAAPWFINSGAAQRAGIVDNGLVVFGEFNYVQAPSGVNSGKSIVQAVANTGSNTYRVKYYGSNNQFDDNLQDIGYAFLSATSVNTLTTYSPGAALNLSCLGEVVSPAGSEVTLDMPSPVWDGTSYIFENESPGGTFNAMGYFYAINTLFRGYVGELNVSPLENGLGTRTRVVCYPSIKMLENTVFFRGKVGTAPKQATGTYKYGIATTTFEQHLENIRSKLNTLNNDAYLRKIIDLSTTIVNNTGSNPALGEIEYPVNDGYGTLTTLLSALSDATGLLVYLDVNANTGVISVTSPGYKAATTTERLAPFYVTTNPSLISLPTNAILYDTDTAATAVSATRSVIMADNMELTYDHSNIVKSALFRAADDQANLDTNTTQPYRRTYNLSSPQGTGLSTRVGPLTSAIVQAPLARGKTAASRGARLDAYATKFFGDASNTNRRAPLPNLSFTISGAASGASDLNRYGWVIGYTGTEAAPDYSARYGWIPGATVYVNAPELGIGDSTPTYVAYQIVSVTTRFENDSSIRRFDIQCERRRPNSLGRELKLER